MTLDRRECTVAEVQHSDFIEIWDDYGEVTEVVEHGRMIGDGTVDWFTFRVQFEHDPWPTTVGPLRGDRMVVNWS